ncbi:membrane lipoprotein [Streptomyces bungoensis]|uniref:Membrane lipoprotein n=1 Tax=Streptomyces bungoensis TaxID=285568 RepID=A0A101TCD9_9ACTN|nr:hypothetical protein [Streptomyces bungoensis]KUN89752.1 membrane lipoprotein [Streptomyces bungoensis]
MIRTARLLPPLLLLPALLAGCGTEKAGKADAGSARPSSAAPHPDRAALEARVEAMGIAPDLVYVTRAPGFTLAQQSVGVNGDDGFSAAYWAEGGAVLHLYVDRPAHAGRPAYAVAKKGCVVRLSGEHVPGAVLRAALRAVHRPSTAELAALLPPSAPAPTGPVRRGDLPSTGDGAPDNSVTEGG